VDLSFVVRRVGGRAISKLDWDGGRCVVATRAVVSELASSTGAYPVPSDSCSRG